MKICIIGVYFGKFPNYFNLWLKSCKYNPTIDFLIFTDNKLENLPSNVYVINITLQEMQCMAEDKLQMNISLGTPYKCCDYKPVYGIIFSDYCCKYDYWGHCDFDMIFGDIQSFIDKYELNKYDKFLPLGHLTLYRNTEECNFRYLITPKLGNSYKHSFSIDQTTQFDEIGGINAIYNENGFPFFKKRIFADISWQWNRMKLAELYADSEDLNYKYQVFYWKKGKIFREYIHHNIVKREEYIYIHIKKRKFEDMNNEILSSDQFYINSHQFIIKQDEKINKILIQKQNHCYGKMYELVERTIINRIKNRFK